MLRHFFFFRLNFFYWWSRCFEWLCAFAWLLKSHLIRQKKTIWFCFLSTAYHSLKSVTGINHQSISVCVCVCMCVINRIIRLLPRALIKFALNFFFSNSVVCHSKPLRLPLISFFSRRTVLFSSLSILFWYHGVNRYREAEIFCILFIIHFRSSIASIEKFLVILEIRRTHFCEYASWIANISHRCK